MTDGFENRAFIGLLASMLLPAAAHADGRLEGVVFDASGSPLAEVEVTVDGRVVAQTDSDGAFSFGLEAGEHDVSVPGVEACVAVADDRVSEVLLTVGSAPLIEAPPVSRVITDQATAPLRGVVLDEQGRPLDGARVFVRGHPVEATTDAAGAFSVSLPPGSHELSVLKSGYSTQAVTGVDVGPEGGEVRVELVEAGLALADFDVRVPRITGGTSTLLAERQQSGELVDTLGAEEMSRRGDSSAAGALQRVTGLTLVGGKYVYVRGLGERYSTSLLNGASLPSPEPERRVVPLDLFPTAMLESVVVQKTFSPSMPAEFGGGVVNLRTRGVPDEPVLSVSLSTTYIDGITFQEGLVGDRGPTDWLGFDGGYRDLPDAVEEAAEAAPIVQRDNLPRSTGYTTEELEVLGEAMPNRWGLELGTALPDLSLSAVAGRGFDVGGSRLGVLGGLTFSNGWDRDEYTTTWYAQSGDGLKVLNQYDFEDMSNEVGLGGLVELGLELPGEHEVRSTTLLTRDSESLARRYIGYNNDIGTDIRVQRVRWVERQLLVEQVSGRHRVGALNGAGVDWRYAFAVASRDEPDRRDVLQQPDDDGGWYLRTQGGGNDIFYSELDDTHHDVGLDLVAPVGDSELRLGGELARRERAVDTRRFGYDLKSTGEDSDTSFLTADPEDIFVPDNIGPGALQFEETTQATDNYRATQGLEAAYVEADARLPWRTSLLAGLRCEHSAQLVETFQLFQPDLTPVTADLETTDWLPAATLTKALTRPDAAALMQVRLGYGRTVSRPDFRELSPAVFNDVVGGREVAGNADLQRATIDNWDARWEWYFGGDESLSLGAFHKHFTQPIETVVLVGAVSRTSYDNAEAADNTGVELEWRKAVVADLYLAGNAALIHSRVDLGEVRGNQTSTVRPLQGQSPHVLNLQLTWEGEPWSAALLYNVSGPRIAEVGDGGLPDTYEQPVHRVDAVLSREIGRGWRIKASGRNLLDSRSRLMMGDVLVREQREGWSVGLGVGWSAE